MTSTYTVPIARGGGSGSSNIQLYAVSGDTTVVLRDLVADSPTPVAAQFIFYVVIPGTGNVTLFRAQLTTTLQHLHQELRQALMPGDQLWLSVNSSSTWTYAVTGYLFD